MVDKTECKDCGAVLGHNVIQEQKPCPNCGSTQRLIYMTTVALGSVTVARPVSTQVAISFEVMEAAKILSSNNLLLQTVVSLGAKTTEGQLIEMVTQPWFEIIDALKKNSDMRYSIPPRKWEEIIAGAYKKAGFDEVTLTPQSGDYGRDVIAVKHGIGSVRVIDQVKAYHAKHLVTANDVRALMGVLQCDSASKGFITTTSDFAPRIATDPLIRPLIPSRLELINGKNLLSRLEELAKR